MCALRAQRAYAFNTWGKCVEAIQPIIRMCFELFIRAKVYSLLRENLAHVTLARVTLALLETR